MDPGVDDARLIEASLSDPAVFAGLYDRHAPSLARYLIRRVGVADGEALLGELFRVAFESRDRYRLDRADARPWLYGIAAKLVMKHLRGLSRGRRVVQRLAGRREVGVGFDEHDHRVRPDPGTTTVAASPSLGGSHRRGRGTGHRGGRVGGGAPRQLDQHRDRLPPTGIVAAIRPSSRPSPVTRSSTAATRGGTCSAPNRRR